MNPKLEALIPETLNHKLQACNPKPLQAGLIVVPTIIGAVRDASRGTGPVYVGVNSCQYYSSGLTVQYIPPLLAVRAYGVIGVATFIFQIPAKVVHTVEAPKPKSEPTGSPQP